MTTLKQKEQELELMKLDMLNMQQKVDLLENEITDYKINLFEEKSKFILFGNIASLQVESNLDTWLDVKESLKDNSPNSCAYISVKQNNSITGVGLTLNDMIDLRDHLTTIIDYIQEEE